MLRRRLSQTPLVAGLVEHECPRCHRPVEQPFGTLCAACRAGIERRASRMAAWAAGLSTLALAIYALARMPDDPRARLMSGLAVAVWYVLVRQVVARAARELLP
jgi:hypothetical protein